MSLDFVDKAFANLVLTDEGLPDIRAFVLGLIAQRDAQWADAVRASRIAPENLPRTPAELKQYLMAFERQWARNVYESEAEHRAHHLRHAKAHDNMMRMLEPLLMKGLKVLEDGTCVPVDEQ